MKAFRMKFQQFFTLQLATAPSQEWSPAPHPAFANTDKAEMGLGCLQGAEPPLVLSSLGGGIQVMA